MAVGDFPTPDPTVLTTAQLERAIKNLQELFDSQLKGLAETRNEKFHSVAEQFALIERLRVEQKSDTKQAVDAALAAAKEAVGKSEASTKEQLAQITLTFNTAIGALTKEISDLKERIGDAVAVKRGGDDQRSESRSAATFIQGLVVAGVLVLGFLFSYSFHRAPAPQIVTVPTVLTVSVPATTGP